MNIIVKIILTMIMAVGGYFIMKDAYTDNIKPIQSADLKIIAYFFWFVTYCAWIVCHCYFMVLYLGKQMNKLDNPHPTKQPK